MASRRRLGGFRRHIELVIGDRIVADRQFGYRAAGQCRLSLISIGIDRGTPKRQGRDSADDKNKDTESEISHSRGLMSWKVQKPASSLKRTLDRFMRVLLTHRFGIFVSGSRKILYRVAKPVHSQESQHYAARSTGSAVKPPMASPIWSSTISRRTTGRAIQARFNTISMPK